MRSVDDQRRMASSIGGWLVRTAHTTIDRQAGSASDAAVSQESKAKQKEMDLCRFVGFALFDRSLTVCHRRCRRPGTTSLSEFLFIYDICYLFSVVFCCFIYSSLVLFYFCCTDRPTDNIAADICGFIFFIFMEAKVYGQTIFVLESRCWWLYDMLHAPCAINELVKGVTRFEIIFFVFFF